MKIVKTDEAVRRSVVDGTDAMPSLGHKTIFDLSKKYIVGKTVLDIGCWTGQYEYLAKNVVKKIIGIDPGKDAIDFAQRLYKKEKNVSFVVGRAEKLDFKDNTFDTVVFSEVIEHISAGSEKAALSEISRVLKKNGILFLSTPYKHLFSILLDPAYFIIGHRHYSKPQIETILHDLNMETQEPYVIGGFAVMFTSILEMVWKHVFRQTFVSPVWWKNIVERDQYAKGFSRLVVVAKKIG